MFSSGKPEIGMSIFFVFKMWKMENHVTTLFAWAHPPSVLSKTNYIELYISDFFVTKIWPGAIQVYTIWENSHGARFTAGRDPGAIKTWQETFECICFRLWFAPGPKPPVNTSKGDIGWSMQLYTVKCHYNALQKYRLWWFVLEMWLVWQITKWFSRY